MSDDDNGDVDKDGGNLGNLTTAGNESTFNPDVKNTRSKAAAEKQNYASSVQKSDCYANPFKKEPEYETPGHRKSVEHLSKVCRKEPRNDTPSHTGEVSCYSLYWSFCRTLYGYLYSTVL